MDAKQAVGVFDSGLGGISVLRELCRVLPQENFIYYGDSANAPYGDKTNEAILALSERITDYLLSRNVKAIVIACNTATRQTINFKAFMGKYFFILLVSILLSILCALFDAFVTPSFTKLFTNLIK